jgi:hypothetical protein
MKYFASQIKKSIILGIIFNGGFCMEQKPNQPQNKADDFEQIQYKWIINDPNEDGVKRFYNDYSRAVTRTNILGKRGTHTQIFRLVPVTNNPNPISTQNSNLRDERKEP